MGPALRSALLLLLACVAGAALLRPAELEQQQQEDLLSAQFRRTATGGVMQSALTLLTLAAFAGNFSFAVYVFWLSK